VGNFIQAVLQGSFILAKAKQGPEVVREDLELLRRTLRVLFQPDTHFDSAKEANPSTTAASHAKKKDHPHPASPPKPVEEPEEELEEEYDNRLSHFVD
jgi:hypothetical protein